MFMIELRPSTEIVGADNGWLKAKHHFAIGHYGNPAHGPLGNLYVLNDDEIAPHSGFGLHYHANVEIITYVREGVVTHEDDLGNRGQTLAGNVQVMSAGTGIEHSERNEENVPTRMFQIWLTPRAQGGSPHWGTKPFPKADRSGSFIPLASGRAANEALSISADAEVSGAVLEGGSITEYKLAPGDAAYLVPAVGSVSVNGTRVHAREGLIIREETSIRIEALVNAEVVLIVTTSERSQ
jgi:redox-sensitive bicupin YhaK (pirin superfamily)